MMTREEAEDTASDGYRTIIAPSWSHVNIGEGWMVTVTPAGRACGCGKGLECSENARERE